MHEVCVHKYKWQWHAWLVAIGTECWQTCLETTLIVINNTIYKKKTITWHTAVLMLMPLTFAFHVRFELHVQSVLTLP